MQEQRRFAERGQTLIEAIVAISLIILGILGVFRLMSQSIGLTRVVREQYVATYLAAEGVELVKNMTDTNILEGTTWNNGFAVDGQSYEIDYLDTVGTIEVSQDRFLRFDPATGFYSYDSTNPETTRFKRVITITYPDCPSSSCTEHMQVNSVVSWTTRGGGTFETDVEDHLFYWNQ